MIDKAGSPNDTLHLSAMVRMALAASPALRTAICEFDGNLASEDARVRPLGALAATTLEESQLSNMLAEPMPAKNQISAANQ